MGWDRRGALLQMMPLEGQEGPLSGAFESVALGCPGLPIPLAHLPP